MKVKLTVTGGPTKTYYKYETNLETDPDPQELERLVKNSGILNLQLGKYRFCHERLHKFIHKYIISIELEPNELELYELEPDQLESYKILVIYDDMTLVDPVWELYAYLENPKSENQ